MDRIGPEIRFACDAMLGALARWLRAAGYDCTWREGIADAELVELARREDRILLTADSGIFKRKVVYQRHVKALLVPRDMPRHEQVAHVLRTLRLPRREPRCMMCGGELEALDRDTAAGLVPAGAFRAFQDFYRCTRCRKVYWEGTHWSSIDRRLRALNLETEE